MYKLNVLPVKLLTGSISKNGAIFSHEHCDVCGTQGIVYEAISYSGTFDYNKLKYHGVTYKRYAKLNDVEKQIVNRWYTGSPDLYVFYYLCSEACAMMVQLQRE